MRQINSQLQAFLSAFEAEEQEDMWGYLGEAQDFCNEFMDALPAQYHVNFPEILAFMNWVDTFSDCLEKKYQSLIPEAEETDEHI